MKISKAEKNIIDLINTSSFRCFLFREWKDRCDGNTGNGAKKVFWYPVVVRANSKTNPSRSGLLLHSQTIVLSYF